MPDLRFRPEYRIRRGTDFRRAYRRRNSTANAWLVMYGFANGLPYPRLGISASRRIGNAVVRNRWKRLIREAFRLTRSQLPPGIDLIVVPRPVATPSLDELLAAIPKLAANVQRNLRRR